MHTDKGMVTFWSDFVLGKMAYLDKQAPGSTSMSAMYDPDLLDLPAGTQLPPTVHADPPTPSYLLSELGDKEDVEILFQGDLNNYVTLTSITFDFDKNKGTINYIDPDLGNLVQNVAIELFDEEHPLFFGDSEITLAVSESPNLPTPEPSVLVLLISGAAGILVRGRRRAG